MNIPTSESRELPNWIEAFMLYTENTEPPRLFRKWTAISCIASALQRKCFIEWGTSLTFYPNLYIVLVGPSASGKGTAMNPGLDILKEIPTIRKSAQSTSLQALIRHLKDNNLTDIDHKTGNQIFHSSLTVFSKEFTVFLGYHNSELMAALCDWYDCDGDWTYETISRKRETITGVWVNLFGATTPDLIKSSLPVESIGGGLTSRIIFVCEEKKDKLITIPIQSNKEKELFQILVNDLDKISRLTGHFGFTQGFAELWHNWCCEAEANPPFNNPKFDGYIGRRRTHLMKLSMIMAVARPSDTLTLTQDDLQSAIDTLKEVEVKMGKVFEDVGKQPYESQIMSIMNFIHCYSEKEVPYHYIVKHFGRHIDIYQIDKALFTFEKSNMIKVIQKPGGEKTIIKLPECSNF